MESGREIARIPHRRPVERAAFVPGARTSIASLAVKERAIRIWDTVSAREVHRFKYRDGIGTFGFSPGGEYLAPTVGPGPSIDSLAEGLVAVVPSVRDDTEVARIRQPGPLKSVEFSRDGLLLATASDDGTALRTGAHR